MYNWSTDIKKLKKDKKAYAIWRLEQLVNFGLNGQKISKKQLKKYWPYLNLDPIKKHYLTRLLWPKKS
jgi:hypothetical protein